MRWFVSLVVVLCACGADGDHDHDEVPEIVSFTVDPGLVEAGAEAQVQVEVEHFDLGGGEHHMHEKGSASGHVHIYLNDTESNPLLMMMGSMGTVTIPADTEVGVHALIARLHDSGHLIIEPEVTAEVEIDVFGAVIP